MSTLPPCPKCHSELTYEDGPIFVCPECAHEWKQTTEANSNNVGEIARDAHGNVLKDGDTVSVIKDLKVRAHRRSSKWARK